MRKELVEYNCIRINYINVSIDYFNYYSKLNIISTILIYHNYIAIVNFHFVIRNTKHYLGTKKTAYLQLIK